MTAKDAYDILTERLEFPGSARLRRALKATMTPEQAQIVVELPGSAEEVATKTNLAPERVKSQLDELFFKGIVFPRGGAFDNRQYYRFARSIGVLRDSVCSNPPAWDLPKDKEFFEIWYDFSANEMYPQHARDRQAKGEKRPSLRIVPAYKSIEGLPDILPCEDFRQLLAAQESIVVVPCPCRYIHDAGGHPCKHTHEQDHWMCFQFSKSAEYALKLGKAKKLSLEEALALNDTIEEDGILHIWYTNDTSMANVKWSCQCCTDCCTVVVPLVQAGLPLTYGWEKSRYQAYTNTEDCNGCQVCIDRCHFDAIEMQRVEGSKKLKAVVDAEKCFGCGVCVVGCEPEALKMKVVRPPEFIPAPVD